ncbi:hypothetical protein RGQ13_11320 [Thalassotalea psychrophila]|uniref:Lipoprotein n=1 Tax=Thalassotalea psychrophila TaxID=3065647 RepID=A0ABY9TPS7_9GAMM|nr:hypothetical protein RGQ13_11320 [Colwelliaceae bacterium SQ149]
MKYPLIFSVLFLLTSCGDNIDESGIITPGEPSVSLVSGKNADLILLKPKQSISEINWQQTSGETVEFLSEQSKVISFTIPSAGDYSFEVSYVSDGNDEIEKVTFTAETGSPKLVARLGHSVVEDAGVSLRVFTSSDIDLESISWQQLSGPEINFDTDNTNKEIAIFNSPKVLEDSIIEIEVSAQDTSGSTYKDVVSVLIEDRPGIPSNAYFDDDDPGSALANVYVYNPNSAYKDALINCVYSNQLSSSCDLGELPILADETNGDTPSIEQIMDRVVVSHDWMAENFKAYLETFDTNNDFKNLLRATTAIVLSYDIRPSFYWAATGAIYLDPNNLWLTAQERDTINEAPDYRANFGSELQFVMPWRYVKNNDYVSFSFPVSERLDRDLAHIKYDLADLLYHELAHANDYFPQTEWGTYSGSTRFLDAALNKAEISDDLIVLFPLQSQEMKDLAAVRFLGEDANAVQKSYKPDDVSIFYKDDVSNGFYNYTNEKEDLGILFESLMMSLRYGVQRDTAVTSDRDGGYVVSWGQRGRIADSGVSERASYVTSRLLPEFDLTLIDTLPAPIQMTKGLDWWDNLPISPQGTAQLQSKSQLGNKDKAIRIHQAHGKPLPRH